MFRGALGIVTAVVLASACAGTGSTVQGGVLHVVAGENFWGDIAAQLGGTHARVQSVVTDPNADPHEYESNTNDARAFATANLVMLNGAGYDDWGQKLLDANPAPGRKVLNLAQLLGKKPGDNPHFWYGPDFVTKVADRITSEYTALDAAETAYFERQRDSFTAALEPYTRRLSEIKQKFAGVPIGSTESIFVYMADYLGLKVLSPADFMQAVSEGNDPPAASVVVFHDQIARKAIRVLVYNVQTSTAVTTNLKDEASRQSIPVVGVYETVPPGAVSFQQWQAGQLVELENALETQAAAP